MPNPAFFGFPPRKFPAYRAGQLELAYELAESQKRFKLFQVPPGGGKSLLYMTVARILARAEDRNLRTLVLVGTKGLQQQIAGDAFGAVDIYGHNNYECLGAAAGGPFPEYADPAGPVTCDVGPCRVGESCELRDAGCLSYDARRRAAAAPTVVANYSLWMALGRYGEPETLGKFDLLVADEAHVCRDWLSKACTIEFSGSDLTALQLRMPPTEAGIAACSEWARAAIKVIGEKIEIMQRFGSKMRVREVLRLRTLQADLSTLALLKPDGPTTWIPESTRGRTGWGARFSPLWAGEFAEKLLFQGIPNVLLSSATLSELEAKYLNIPKADYAYFERASTFDPTRRPLYYLPCGVSLKRGIGDAETQMWVNTIDSIIKDRTDRRGIIHTVSYERARDLMARSRHKHLMVSHTDSSGLREAIARFKDARTPQSILVSPSVSEGHDFPDCVAPDTKLLSADLRWVSAGDVGVGDRLIGFDEMELVFREGRYWRECEVIEAETKILDCYRLVMADGTEFVCSANHPWLTYSAAQRLRWVETKNLKRASALVKIVEPWISADSRAVGYLAAAYDGEGSLQIRRRAECSGGNKPIRRLAFDQTENPMLGEVRRFLVELGFDFNLSSRLPTYPGGKEQFNLLATKSADIIRFLGMVRPARLLPKLKLDGMGNIVCRPIHIIAKESVGKREVAAISTTTKTYVAAGFAAHNSQCRYQIIAKIPFMGMGDPVTKARMAADKKYSTLVTALTIIQMYGRGMRAEHDWAECFIVDEQWRWFQAAAKKLGVIPWWFESAWRWVDWAPKPLNVA